MNRFLGFMIGAALIMTALGCGKGTGKGEAAGGEPGAMRVVVIQPRRGDAVRSITLPGDLVGFYESALHAKVTGYLEKINVDKGDWVKQGQVLATIEVPELHQNLQRAQANRQVQRLTYERLKKVRDSDPRLVAQETVDIAYGKWAEANAEVGVLETMVSYTKIVAPFNGVITGRFADPGALIRAGGGDLGVSGIGSFVSPGATEGSGGHLGGGGPLVTIAKIDKLRIYIYLPEQEAGLVRIGMPATLKVRAFPGKKFEARVSRFATSLDLSTRTMLTELDIDNPDHRLYPRMYGDVTLDLIRHRNAIELPPAAVGGLGGTTVSSSGNNAFVFVVRDNKLVKVPISTGIANGRYVEILSGLSGDEMVVSSLTSALSNGEKVQPVLLKAEDRGFAKHQVASSD